MSWFTKVLSPFIGYDTDELQRESDRLDQQLADLNRQALEEERISQATYDQMMRNLDASRVDADADVTGAFLEGAKEGAQKELELVQDVATGTADAVNKTLSFSVGTIFRAIPLSVWIIAAIALFVWMGGLTWLRGVLAKRS